MDCPSCAAQNPEGKSFCGECGSPLPRSCPSCGGENPATNRFCGDCGARLTGDKPTPAADHMPQARVGAERRQLTVLFCDLVGSTELSARLDPEDMREVIRAYQQCCADIVKRWDGYIANYMGDGVLALFGYPQAHEDDAERAVRTGLEMTAAVAKLTGNGAPLAARVGIATGQVVVGELFGEGSQEQPVVGDTPNLAARLQTLAEPGTVVVAAGTRRLLGGLFELADLGPTRLKGFAEPLGAFRVVGEGSAEGRFEALRGQRLTPLIGREHELAILMERWAWAKEGDGQVVLISGEPGIGKSRLIRALRQELSGEPHFALSHFCSPYHTNSALYPVIAQLERAAGFTPEDRADARLDKLEALLGKAADQLDEAVPLIGALLGLPESDRYTPLDLSPERQKQRTLEILVEQLAELARDRPVLELYEDVHWIDPTTLEMLDLLIEQVRALPTLVVLTCRPEFGPRWSGRPHVTSLPLNRLGRRQGAAMVERVSSGQALPVEVVDQIVLRTDGVPLFVEELTKAVLESNLLVDSGGHLELTGPHALPSTLHDSLMARLDRLASAKDVAQIAAVIGREFSHDLLTRVAPMPAHLLSNALGQLVQSELVFRRGVPPDVTYTFKHALVQEAAYQSVLKAKRQQLHARIGEALEERLPNVGETRPEVLAQHFTHAGLNQQAIRYWQKAGKRASSRSAHLEAIAHLSKGLELIEAVPNVPGRAEEELALLVAIGVPLIATKGYPSEEVRRTYSRALALCDELGRSAELLSVLRGLWSCYFARGELQQALDLAERLVSLAGEQGATAHDTLAGRALGPTLLLLGRLAEASESLDRGVAVDGTAERAQALLHGELPGVWCRMYASWALWLLGFPERAVETMEGGVHLDQRASHPFSVAVSLGYAAILHVWRGDFVVGRSRAEAAMAIAREHRLPLVLSFGTLGRGSALSGLGQQVEAVKQLRSGLARWNAVGARVMDTQWLCFIAAAHARAGEYEEAFSALDDAVKTSAATGESHYLAELSRIRGMVLAETGDHAEAASRLYQALDTARAQQSKSLELRAATSLARLWRHQGKRVDARELLAPIYGWFTEGFDTADLKDAKALLDALA